MAKQGFVRADIPQKGRGYHGMASYVRTSPDVRTKNGVKSMNIQMTLEEALKLRLALDSCLQSINRYNRNTAKGRAIGVHLSVKTDNTSIVVIEAPMRPEDSPAE